MATYQEVRTVSVEAGSAVTVYRLVAAAADKQYDHAGAGARVDGIAAESIGAVGQALAMVIPDGAIAKVETGAALSANDTLESDASGRAITHVSGVGKYRVGRALDAAGGAGEIIRIQFSVELDEVT